MGDLRQISTEELKRELQVRGDKIGNVIAHIIRISNNIDSMAIDALDGYCTIGQFKAEISQCLEEIRTRMEEL